ncbi:MAG: hypothetical protein WD871_06135 [Xanthobacteraceae bacterium]
MPSRRRASAKGGRIVFAAWPRVVSTVVAIALFGAAQIGAVLAQPAPQGIIAVGNGVFTGFSGTVPPALPLPPGVLPADRTYIDLAGPSARVVDLQNMGGPPAAQLVNAPKPFTATAAQLGQVYAVALDNATPPNIYVAATSSYGLPIVVPDKDGDGRPDRVKQGAPNASFMPGLWGPPALGGGPGSIWRIDGVTGAVTLFANVLLGGVPNSGPALGGLAFDSANNQLIVADRDTGMIHRFTLDGVERGVYDHGVTGRAAAGLPPVPFNPANRLNITNPAFQVENSSTWQLAPKERLIYGLGVRGSRLYYALADGLWIWSVGINIDGSFAADARIEVNVPPALAPTEIAKIIFDDQGRMILGERGVPVGLYDFSVLAQESVSRVLRYARIVPGPGLPPVWQPVPDEYAIGFPVQYRNANGGVAIGYRYDVAGRIDRYSCGGFLWSTGEQLRKSSDPAIAARLAGGGPAEVNGLQGNEIELVRPQNVPPFQTYFIDYDDEFNDPAALGHMGDVAILRICGQGFLPGFGWFSPPGWAPPWWWGGPPGFCPPWLITPGGLCGPPPLWCPPGQQQPGFQCCPEGTLADAAGVCRPICPNGASDPDSLFACALGFDNTTIGGPPGTARCIGGALPIPGWGIEGCGPHSPLVNPAVCPAGHAKVTRNFPDGSSYETCAPLPGEGACQAMGPGWHLGLDGSCQLLCPGGGTPYQTVQCCPPGAVVNPAGLCCPYGSYVDPATGQCTPPWSCPPGWIPNPIIGGCCPPGSVIDPVTGACSPGGCPPGWVPNPIIGGCCPPGSIVDPVTGACTPTGCPPGWVPNPVTGGCCPPGSIVDPVTGACVPNLCPPGWVPNPVTGGCCPPGSVVDPVSGKCDPPDDKCPPGWIPNPVTGGCCPPGSIVDPVTGACTPGCPPGWVPNPILGGCCPPGSVINPATGLCEPPKQCPPGWVPNPITGGCCPPGSVVNPATGQCTPTNPCPPGWVPNPVLGGCCPPGSIVDPKTGLCRPDRGCPEGWTPNPVTGGCCPPGTTLDTITGQCEPPDQCPEGWIVNPVTGGCCPPGSTINTLNGQCTPPGGGCPPGAVPIPGGGCCPPDSAVVDGQCRPVTETCRPGHTLIPLTGFCCRNTQLSTEGNRCCPLGTTPAPNNQCEPVVEFVCPQGEGWTPHPTVEGRCCPPGTQANTETGGCNCPDGSAPDTRTGPDTGQFCPPAPPSPAPCPEGQILNRATGQCVSPTDQTPPPPPPPPPPTCPRGTLHNTATSQCVTPTLPTPPPLVPVCPPGLTHNRATSGCSQPPPPPTCPQGMTHNRATSACTLPPPPPTTCPQGTTHNRATSSCSQIPPPPPTCPQGMTHNRATSACTQTPPPPTTCPQGTTHNRATSACSKPPAPTCPTNTRHVTATSACTSPPKGTTPTLCPTGSRHSANTSACTPITIGPLPLPPCPQGTARRTPTGPCLPIGTKPPPPPKTLTVPPKTLTLPPCPAGTARNAQGQCVRTPPPKLQINPNLLKPLAPQTVPR